MSSLLNFTPPVVKRLLNWRIPGSLDDEKWTEKAVKSLVKKLKKSGLLDELERVITNQDSCSRCITIPRSLDGRLQVSHRKGLPHVIYCRLWRWPDLQSHHELKPIDTCEFAFHHKRDEVCVNPYHYQRIETPALPPIYVSMNQPDKNLQINSYDLNNNAMLYDNRIPFNFSSFSNYDLCCDNNNAALFKQSLSEPMLDLTENQYFYSKMSNSNNNYNISNSNNFQSIPCMNDNSMLTDSDLLLKSQGVISEMGSACELSNDLVNNKQVISTTKDGNFLSSVSNGNYRTNCQPPPNDLSSYFAVPYEETNAWCSIVYHEYDKVYGDVFHSTSHIVTIDCSNFSIAGCHFSLGSIINPDRAEEVIQCRNLIGQGVKLYYFGGEVFIESLSRLNSIFVQSVSCNFRQGWNPSAVCRVGPNCSLKVFNSQEFAFQLSHSIQLGYEAVFSLTRMCTIRMSFTKGWGMEYRRQTITTTPVWLDIRLNGPLQWLDRVLVQMGSPNTKCTSVS